MPPLWIYCFVPVFKPRIRRFPQMMKSPNVIFHVRGSIVIPISVDDGSKKTNSLLGPMCSLPTIIAIRTMSSFQLFDSALPIESLDGIGRRLGSVRLVEETSDGATRV